MITVKLRQWIFGTCSYTHLAGILTASFFLSNFLLSITYRVLYIPQIIASLFSIIAITIWIIYWIQIGNNKRKIQRMPFLDNNE
jgi:hypothetical protein